MSTLFVTIHYWPQGALIDPPFSNDEFTKLLMTLKQTFPYEVSLLATEQSGFHMYASSSRNPPKPVANVLYQTPEGWTETDDATFRDTINTFWNNQAHITFDWETIVPPGGRVRPCTTTEFDFTDKVVKTAPGQAVYITLTTWKMGGPDISKADVDKIAGKIVHVFGRKPLPHDIIFQVKQEDGHRHLLTKGVHKDIPIIQVLIEVDHGVHIETSFDKEVHRILTETYQHPRYYVRVIRK